MFNVLNLFLHVTFAFTGFILWVLGSSMLAFMAKTGRFSELGKPISAIFIASGILLTIMQIFGSISYSPYKFHVESFLDENFPDLSSLFKIKLLLTVLATLTGLGTAAGAWTVQSKKEALATFILALATLALFAASAFIAVNVTSTRSI